LAELSWPFKGSTADGQAVTLTAGGRLAFAQDNTAVPVGFAALEWRPVPQLLLRSRYSDVYRPPTAGELFLGYQERVLPLGNPCAGLVGVSALCSGGLVPNAANATVAAPSESDYLIAGNPHLRPERGSSASAGIVWNSLDHPARRASLDLTWIRLDDAIRGPAALELLAACQSGTDSAACARIVAVPGSNVYAINGSLINGGRDDSARADFKFGDSLETRAGELRLEGFASYLLMRRITDITGRNIDLRGTFDLTQNVLGTAYPLMLAQAHLAWKRQSWTARWSTDFIGSYRETVDRNGLLVSSGGEVRTVGSTVYHDLTLERAFGGFAALRFSVENVFDRSPPRVNNAVEDNTDAATYRLEGRIFAVSAELTF